MNAIHLVFENGLFQEHLSNHADLPSNISFQYEDKILFRFAKYSKLELPIHLKFINLGKEVSLQIHIIAEEHSRAVMMEEYMNQTHHKTQAAIQFELHPHAEIHYYKLQNEGPESEHYANLSVDQQKGSEINLFFADCGSQSAYAEVNVKLREREAVCHLKGIYFLKQDHQSLNYKINVEHMGEHGESSMLFKGILDKKSRALFHGKVHIQQQAQYSKTEQANHNLLLSQHAEVKTEPHLEIYADEVKCRHGATVGQLDPESLFYLRSRGIDPSQSLQMLTQAFAFDVINKIEDLSIQKTFKERVIPYAEC